MVVKIMASEHLKIVFNKEKKLLSELHRDWNWTNKYQLTWVPM